MGNYIISSIAMAKKCQIFNNPTDKFLQYNLIDEEYKIILGIYSTKNTNQYIKSNTMINQGICVGYGNNTINKIKMGIIHKYCSKVELYFENNIKLSFELENGNKDEMYNDKNEIYNNENKIKMILSFNGTKVEKYLKNNIIKNFKSINNNSEYIDLITQLIN